VSERERHSTSQPWRQNFSTRVEKLAKKKKKTLAPEFFDASISGERFAEETFLFLGRNSEKSVYSVTVQCKNVLGH